MSEFTHHHDKIMSKFAKWKSQEATRASDVGEQREEIGALLELTGINKKAFAFVRSLDKLEADKRSDVLRSLTPMLDMFDRHWNGNATPDMLDKPLPKPTYAADLDLSDDAPEPEDDNVDDGFDEDGDPEIQEEADDFDDALARAAE